MKFALVLLAVVGVASAVSTYGLREDVDKIRSLIPVDKIRGIIKKYKDAGDKEVLEIGEFVRSEEFKNLGKKTWAIPEVKKLVSDLEAAGLNVKELVRDIAAAVGIPLYAHMYSESITYGWRDMAKEIRALIPVDEIIVTVVELLQTSEDFQDLYKRVSSPESREVARTIAAFPETKAMVTHMRAHGLDVDKAVRTIKDLLGWY